MTPSGSIALQLALSVVMVIFTSYVAGRVHQWYRHGFERDVAYREGYDQASQTLFQLAVRTHPALPTGTEPALRGHPALPPSPEVENHVRSVAPTRHRNDPPTAAARAGSAEFDHIRLMRQ
ncbi:hypothetical protein GCM10010435_16960 [Winogradskya consettensis]|uniref:Uncharacterized protein n=2 Tax=Winogradskya TaxID=3240235 RepID=A0A919VWV9_9ACTN|nr:MULTISPECIES: hypothetical protein [Actinoplanes]GIE21323.1 hypothetical protein Ahu01nite_044250 [Actinoplanes humidus]GIM78762.1 hypothetical protein Aco04nite_62090 [Actinoplanes consettensis]